jgi:hypothetical protein
VPMRRPFLRALVTAPVYATVAFVKAYLLE